MSKTQRGEKLCWESQFEKQPGQRLNFSSTRSVRDRDSKQNFSPRDAFAITSIIIVLQMFDLSLRTNEGFPNTGLLYKLLA